MLPKRIRIEVTERDIKLGCPVDGTSCPIARAVRRALKRRSGIFVSPDKFSLFTGIKFTEHYSIPLKAARFIEKFDAKQPGQKFKPFSFIAIRKEA